MNDFEGIRHRLIQVQKEFKLKDTALAKICSVSHTAIANIIKGRTGGFDVMMVARISKSLKVNAHWIITGEGSMKLGSTLAEDEVSLYKVEPGKTKLSVDEIPEKNNQEIPEGTQEIATLKSELLSLHNEIQYLKSKIQDKEEIIALLKDQLKNRNK